MKQWESHFSYANFNQIIEYNDVVYAVANGSLCSIDEETGEITSLSKIDGFHNANISKISYNDVTKSMLVLYKNGGMDVVTSDGIYYIADLANKQMNESKNVNDIYMDGEMAYLALPFGIIKVNLKKLEIADTYFLGMNSSAVNIMQVSVFKDSVFAISQDTIFSSHVNSNLSDFSQWNRSQVLDSGELKNIVEYNDTLYLLSGNKVFKKTSNITWFTDYDTVAYKKIKCDRNNLFCIAEDGSVYKNGESLPFFRLPNAEDICIGKHGSWAVANSQIIYHINTDGEFSSYIVDGPANNSPYRMHIANENLYVVPGGRWAAQYFSPACISIFNGTHWHNIFPWQISSHTQKPLYDFMNIAVDPYDPEHFFVTSYGTGIYEFKNKSFFRHYDAFNSPLGSANDEPLLYTRTDAAFFDEDGNLWVINIGNRYNYNLHIIRPSDIATEKEQYSWFHSPFMERPSSPSYVDIGIPQEITVDRFDSRYKWIPQARSTSGLFLFFDNGTPFSTSDDYTIFRSSFVDQDNNNISLTSVYCATQDKDGVIWLGTNNGIITIPSLDVFVSSNSCEKIKIPRDDGSNLADFLLDGIQVNALAIDGANRKWIATATSGIYLMSEDGLHTIEHFTTENSPLPTNEILSIAIEPHSGKVFIGSALGLLSYQSDASEGEPTLKNSNVFAYPNPVRPNYDGYITIRGLMENTVVYIIDSFGNLVCKTYSNGGIAIWNGKNAKGDKVHSGVYTAMCNTKDGSHHTLCKIMIIN